MTGPLATTTFDTVAVVLGGMLVAGALVAGLARRSFLSLTALFVFGGFVLGHGVLDVLSFDPRSGFVASLALVALCGGARPEVPAGVDDLNPQRLLAQAQLEP